MTNNKLISIIIPVFNSEQTIKQLINQLILEVSSIYKIEILLINDNSSDNSHSICKNLQSEFNKIIHYYSLAKNVGEHNAVMTGLNYSSGDYIVIMDDDLQNPVQEVNKLIGYAIKHIDYDVVYTYYDKKKHNLFRNIGSNFNNRIANIMLNKPNDLYLSSFKIINSFLKNEIIKYNLPFPYIDGLILRTTSHIGKIKVEHDSRKFGKSNYTFKKLFSLWLNMFTNFSVLPLRISIFLGFIFAIIGFIIGIISIIEKFQNPDLPMGYAILITSISIFSGAQLIAIGMVGEYIGRIFLSLNKKPQFSIRESHTPN